MKLPKPAGCSFSSGGGNVKERTMIVEEQGIGFWTGVRFPSGPLKTLDLSRVFLVSKTSGYQTGYQHLFDFKF